MQQLYILEKCKFYISPSIYVNLECKFFQKCKSMENVNLQFSQTQGQEIEFTHSRLESVMWKVKKVLRCDSQSGRIQWCIFNGKRLWKILYRGDTR